MIYRGTTPQLVFTLPIDIENFKKVELAISYKGQVILTKTLEDGVVDGKVISWGLTQEETLLFNNEEETIEMQIRAKAEDETAYASQIIKERVKAILKDGVI